MTLTFTATVYLPGFQFEKQFRENPKEFLRLWIEGCASNVCGPRQGNNPLGPLAEDPKAIIRFWEEHTTILAMTARNPISVSSK